SPPTARPPPTTSRPTAGPGAGRPRRSGASPGFHERVDGSPAFEREPALLAVPGAVGHAFVAELVLEDPPDRVARQVVAELDVARHGEVGHPLHDPRAELLLGDGLAGVEHRGDLEVVLADVARDRVDGDVVDRVVSVEDPLHLEARDVLAATAQVVLLAVDEVQEPVLVDLAE